MRNGKSASCPCRLPPSLLLLILLASCSHGAIAQSAQDKSQAAETAEVEVPIIDKVDSRCWTRRLDDPGPVINEETFRELTTPESRNASRASYDRCAFLKRLRVDFSKHSLLTYRVHGDCFIRATAKVTRNDTARKYTLRITRIYGGCRAAGSFESWLVIDKLRPDYKVESVTLERDESAPSQELLKP